MKNMEKRVFTAWFIFAAAYIYTHLVIAFARGALIWPF